MPFFNCFRLVTHLVSLYNRDRHRFIVLYKTAFYSFYLPVALAMLTCSISSQPSLSLAKDILLPLGEYFQVQDDYLDCFGTPEQIGKIGTDIVDNKCSWCINVALARASVQQRAVLDECYGRKDAAKEAKVKEVYEELGLRGVYDDYEQQAYTRIKALIETIPEEGRQDEIGGGVLKRRVFAAFLEKIYKRSK